MGVEARQTCAAAPTDACISGRLPCCVRHCAFAITHTLGSNIRVCVCGCACVQELGGAPPEELAGLVPGRGRPGLGLHDRGDRERRDREREAPGSDPCHLYVGYLAPHVTESMLEGLFRSCGEVRAHRGLLGLALGFFIAGLSTVLDAVLCWTQLWSGACRLQCRL